jgi:hypothetical protein
VTRSSYNTATVTRFAGEAWASPVGHRFPPRQSVRYFLAMHPQKVVRERVKRFTDLPNIGPAAARDFELLGYTEPAQLVGVNPYALYTSLCIASGVRQDPCVLDVFMSVTDFLSGGAPQPWWHYTSRRKLQYGQLQTNAAG